LPEYRRRALEGVEGFVAEATGFCDLGIGA
jgi:hypothetical protein